MSEEYTTIILDENKKEVVIEIKNKIQIVSTQIRENEKNEQITVYEILYLKENKEIYIYKTYNEFIQLNEKLSSKYEKTIKFPTNSWFANKFSKNIIEKTKNDLEVYLNDLENHELYRNDQVFLDFLSPDEKMIREALIYFRLLLFNVNKKKDQESKIIDIQNKIKILLKK
jgi:hypothetical protein